MAAGKSPARGSGRAPAVLALLAAVALLTLGCARDPGPAGEPEGTAGELSAPAPFADRTREAGLDFVHDNGMSGRLYLVEMMGAGVALLDYDGDGDLDLLLRQGAPLGEPAAGAPESARWRDRLYRNDLLGDGDGGRRASFVDVTAASGLDTRGYGIGVAAGDVDNDGWTDLYLTNFGPDELWRNRGDGTFENLSGGSDLDDARLTASAAFLDYDRDGWQDLFVTAYVDFRLANHKDCRTKSGRPDYCGPLSYEPEPDRLLRNRGDGSLEDVSATAGILGRRGAGLGVVVADWNEDGWPDLFVANDGMENFLWINRGGSGFDDEALLAGVAANAMGAAEASMGVAVGDADNDGHEDLFMTHLGGETNTLYESQGNGLFADRTAARGLATASLASTGFGTAFLDYDNDGWLDLVAANGAVRILEELAIAGDPHPLHQADQLFRNRGDGTFVEVTAESGPVFERSEVGRGLAVGDIDNDGDADFVLANNSGPARLLVNQIGAGTTWSGWVVFGRRPGAGAAGARLDLTPKGGPTLHRQARSAAGYASAQDSRILAGLGGRSSIERVRVRLPDGRQWELHDPPVERYLVLAR